MKINLELHKTITIDTSDLDPDLIREAIASLNLYMDENGDELKPQTTLDDSEWKDVIEKLLEDDIDSVCDLNSEVDSIDFTISIPSEDTP